MGTAGVFGGTGDGVAACGFAEPGTGPGLGERFGIAAGDGFTPGFGAGVAPGFGAGFGVWSEVVIAGPFPTFKVPRDAAASATRRPL